MIDLRWTELSLGLSLLFNISFFLFVVIFYKRCVYQPVWQREKPCFGLILFSLFLILFVSANSGSDWYHYQDLVWNYDFSIGAINHGESIYSYIIGFVNKNYLMFRLIVWGGAFLLTCLAFKRFEINVNVAVYFLIAVFLLKFNYARSTLAMANYFLGLSFLVKPIKKRIILSILLTALLFWGAYEFHNSLLPVLILSIVAFIPIERPLILLILVVLLPVFALLISSNFDIIYGRGDEYLSSKLEGYIEQESGSANFLGRIANVLNYGSFVIPILLTSWTIVRNRTVDLVKQKVKYKTIKHKAGKYKLGIETSILRVFRVTFAIALFSASFLLMGLHSSVFFYRYLYMTMIPLTILSVYLYQKRFMSRIQFSIIVLLGMINNMYLLIVGLSHAL